MARDFIHIDPIDLNKNAAVGVVFPFDASAVFNSSYTTKEQVKSNLINVLLTVQGERINEPLFGVGLKKLLFESDIDTQNLESLINEQINLYIPEIELISTEANLDPDKHILLIKISYKFIFNNESDTIQLNFN